MAEVQFDDREIREALQKLQAAAGNLRPALLEIGEVLVESTKQRFPAQHGPDGAKWQDIADITKEAKRKRDNPESILTDYGTLGDTIDYQLLDDATLAVGSPMEYAAMMQFGGTQAEFPHLWGDIPARPFLGISDEDETAILNILQDHLEAALKP